MIEIAWLILLALFVGYYFVRNFEDIRESIADIRMIYLVLSFLSLTAAYLFVTVLIWQSVIAVGSRIPFIRMIYINGVIQLSKYLPGTIWQYVGRAGYYRLDGNMKLKQIVGAITLETVWLISSSIIAAAIFYGLYAQYSVWLVVALIFVWLIILGLVDFKITKQSNWQRILFAQLAQFLIWVCFGISFFVLFAGLDVRFNQLLLVLAAYAISWTIGYVAFFAPGGIGVREFVLFALLGNTLPSDTIVNYLVIHRALTLCAEVTTFLTGNVLLAILGKGVFFRKRPC